MLHETHCQQIRLSDQIWPAGGEGGWIKHASRTLTFATLNDFSNISSKSYRETVLKNHSAEIPKELNKFPCFFPRGNIVGFFAKVPACQIHSDIYRYNNRIL